MSNVYDIFKTDKKLEAEKGIELDYEDFSFQILRASSANKKFMKSYSKITKKYEKQLDRGILGPEKNEKIMHRLYAESIVIGWKGIKDEKGKEIPFSSENCIKLFVDLPELYLVIHQEANNMNNFRGETEKAKKN